ncbi:MAG: hypothetical protein ACXABG_17100 [Promethearchaeota archaeon]|jgi:hypothetical protein
MTNTEQFIADQQKSTKRSRIFYMDNIRVYLTILVVLHHLAVGYGGAGG